MPDELKTRIKEYGVLMHSFGERGYGAFEVSAKWAEVEAAISKMEMTERENAELRKDAERLDFIESNAEGRLLRKYKKRWSFEPVCTNYEYPVFPNLRDALDEAMK
jgi:hypothetical protein